jgi:hypothetical protein
VIKVKLSATEKTAMTAAAARARMATAAWIGQAAMDAAEHRAVPVPEMYRQMLTELIRVADLVHRARVDLNQAVAALNATGGPGPDLEPSAAYCMRAIRQVNEAAELIRRRGLR